jgi:hypothetical protein
MESPWTGWCRRWWKPGNRNWRRMACARIPFGVENNRTVMNGEPNSVRVFRVLSRFPAAPLELRAFAIFSVLATVLEFVLLFWRPEKILESLVPVTGWELSMGYMFGLFFVFALIFMRMPPMDPRPVFVPGLWKPWIWKVVNWQRRRRATRPYSHLRFGFIAPLVLQILFGFWAVMRYNGVNYGNPYLTVSPWQPLWTMGLPALWVLVLFSPRMNRFCNRPPEPSDSLTASV